MIIKEDKPKTRKVGNLEHKLQAEMVKDFQETYPGRIGALVATFQETRNPIVGGIMKSMGLVRGVSDLLYFPGDGCVIAIEVKHLDMYHDVEHLTEQCRWLIKFPTCGRFCHDREDFKVIIATSGNGGGVSPWRVLEKLKRTNKKKIKWADLVD